MILLDVSPPPLLFIDLQGVLEVDPSASTALNVSVGMFLVRGGELKVGTAEQPFRGQFELTFTGARADASLPIYGAKGLFLRGGSIDIHGGRRVHVVTVTRSQLMNDEHPPPREL